MARARHGKKVEELTKASEMSREFPKAVIPPEVTEEGWYPSSERETFPQCAARALKVARDLRRLAREHTYDRVWLVAHGEFLHFLLQALFNVMPGTFETLKARSQYWFPP